MMIVKIKLKIPEPLRYPKDDYHKYTTSNLTTDPSSSDKTKDDTKDKTKDDPTTTSTSSSLC